MEDYFDSYSSTFIYPNNMTKSEWKKYRDNRILPKKIINISISNIKFKFEKEKIQTTFTQNYKSGRLNQTSNKILTFVGENERWLILEETSK